MIKQLTVLDERHVWHGPMCAAAIARGYDTWRIYLGTDVQITMRMHGLDKGGLGFIRPHAAPDRLRHNIVIDDPEMRRSLTMVQDRTQVEVYDNKSEQARRWGHFMPATRIFENKSEALEYVYQHDEPLVAKADVGASSSNVWILRSAAEKRALIERTFGQGLLVSHSSGGGGDKNVRTVQKDRIILQEFIPHTHTLRVNRIGDHYAIFRRYNGPKGTAQTGNVAPVKFLDESIDDLLNFAGKVTNEIGSKWVALDILKQGSTWKLIETSLAWPWPSPGDCDNAPFFRFGHEWETSRYLWRNMWDLMLDEYEVGVFSA